ncbi:MAG: T9SS type A sorting domain-containing protein [Lutibacter sp.]|nr:T9SS type A sorting domain-containing protein [Lutibacter sp.]
MNINGEVGGDLLGNSVYLFSNGSIVAIGAPTNNGNGADSGHARVYDLSSEILGISDEFVVKNFTIYPNPVSTNLYIQLTSELKFISVNIFDYLGENVLKSKKTMLDVSTLSKGVYFLKVETNKGIGIKKVIIN